MHLLLHFWDAALPRVPLKTSLPYPPVSVRQHPLCSTNSLDAASGFGGGGGMCKDSMPFTAAAVGSAACPGSCEPSIFAFVPRVGADFSAHTLNVSEYIAAAQPASSLQRATHAPGVAVDTTTLTPCSGLSPALPLVTALLLPPVPESVGVCAPQHPSARA